MENHADPGSLIESAAGLAGGRSETGTGLQPQESITVPVGIFSAKLGTLEAVTKYLKENKELRLYRIATLLKRDPRTVWGAYQSSTQKSPEPFAISPDRAQENLELPLEIFTDRALGMLESLTWYMRERLGMHYTAIAKIIRRDYSTVWTACTRARTKRRSTCFAQSQKAQ